MYTLNVENRRYTMQDVSISPRHIFMKLYYALLYLYLIYFIFHIENHLLFLVQERIRDVRSKFGNDSGIKMKNHLIFAAVISMSYLMQEDTRLEKKTTRRAAVWEASWGRIEGYIKPLNMTKPDPLDHHGTIVSRGLRGWPSIEPQSCMFCSSLGRMLHTQRNRSWIWLVQTKFGL